MKVLLFTCLLLGSVINAQGNDDSDDGVMDLDYDYPLLPHAGILPFKVKASNGVSYHAEVDNGDLDFVDIQGTFANNHQYFEIRCKRNCQQGEIYSFFLTENKMIAGFEGKPPEILAFIVEIV